MDALQEMDQNRDKSSEPATHLNMALPKAGDKFTDEDLHTRFGVPTEHGIRVSREKKCIVLVHLVGIHSGYTNTDRGTEILYMGENSDRAGLQDQEMSGGNLALSRSREDGYTVLYFIKEGSVLVFRSIVEYDSHKVRNETNGKDQLRKVIEFKLRAVRKERPAAGTDERAAALPAADGAEIEEAYSLPLTGEKIASTGGGSETGLVPPAKAAAALPLSWNEVETMDILADDELMKDIEGGIEDIRAGRVVEWKPRNVQNTKSA